MANIKSKSLKKSLAEQAKDNTTVTRGKKSDQTVLKPGVPRDQTVKTMSAAPIVGVSLGMTLNMDNYESLRADTWMTDLVQEGETTEQAYQRVTKVVQDTLFDIISQYKEED